MKLRTLLSFLVLSTAISGCATTDTTTAGKALKQEEPSYAKAGVGSRVRKRTTVAPADKMSGEAFQQSNNAGRMDLNGEQAAAAVLNR